MKTLKLHLFACCSLLALTGFAQWNPNGDNATTGSITSENPNNPSSVFSMNWQNDIARLRIGGVGDGAENGLEIQGVGDKKLLKLTQEGHAFFNNDLTSKNIISNSNLTVKNPNNLFASVSLNWENNIARLRIGGGGNGAENGFEIKGFGNKSLLKLTQSGDAFINNNVTAGNFLTKGNLTSQNPNSPNASISMNWFNNVARLRIGGTGTGVLNGFEIQGPGDKRLLKLTQSGNLIIDGKIGIGTTTPSEKLTVKGKILCEEVEVVVNANAPDYVFETYYDGSSELKPSYVMPTLEEVEAYTKANNHLPEVPSAKAFKEDGLELKDMSMLLLQKIEELTLYTIAQEKRIKLLEARLND